jgi:hypothetical protein
VNIKNHIPVELDLTDSNYTEWRSFFNTVVGKFGLKSHLTSLPSSANRRVPDWVMIDQCILSWMYNTISKDVLAIVQGLELDPVASSATTNFIAPSTWKPSSAV